MSASAKGLFAFIGTLMILLVVLSFTLLSLLFAARILQFLGETGTNVISRLFGLILAALAVQFILDGVHGSFSA